MGGGDYGKFVFLSGGGGGRQSTAAKLAKMPPQQTHKAGLKM